jgi:diadenylate cyclase
MIDTLVNLFERLNSEAYDPWKVLFELLLIGFCVNWCASVLAGTRGTRLLRGLFVVLLVVTLILRVVSVQSDWTRLELLYRYFIIGLAFTALVAFQPELRRALIRAGEVSFLRRGKAGSTLIAALVESARYLSRNRYGALIAIQRDVGLRDWAENGTRLNAEVSAGLLNSIFFPNTALHDLGVIIEGERVVAAGCQFPQAEGGELDPSLGSRHRAAVGLSQESDALVLVVSEETGTLSIADGGKLVRFLSLDDLEQELHTRLGGRYSDPRRRRALHRWVEWPRVLRRLAVVAPLTVVIWFLAEQASLISRDGMRLRLNIVHDPDLHVEVLDGDTQTQEFTVTLLGPVREVDRLRATARDGPLDVDWKLPPELAAPGSHHVPAATLLSGLPSLARHGVTVQKVNPERVHFAVDEVAVEPMEVRLDPGNVVIGEQRIEPQTVQVSLRKSDLERLPRDRRYVLAHAAEWLSKLPPDQTQTLSGALLSRSLDGVSALAIQPDRVTLTARVLGQLAKKRLTGVSVVVAASVELQQRYSVAPSDLNEWLVDVEVEGDRTRVDALDASDVRGFVVVTSDDAAKGVTSAEVQFVLPRDVRLVGLPPQVRFRLVPKEGAAP